MFILLGNVFYLVETLKKAPYNSGISDMIIIELWLPPTAICCICGIEHDLAQCVGFYCEPTQDEIGSESTMYPGPDNIVGGMPACKACHDEFSST